MHSDDLDTAPAGRDDAASGVCTVVIPARNEEVLLPLTLEAVSAQRLEDGRRLEVVLVDNGSTDRTVEIARAHPGVRVVSSEGSIAAVRNRGAALATGQYVAFLDADCTPPPDWLSCSIALLESRADAVVVSAALKLGSGGGASWIERYWVRSIAPDPPRGVDELTTIASFCFVVRRSAFEAMSGFDERLHTCEDVDLGHRLRQQCGTLLLDRSVGVAHHGNATTARGFLMRQMWQGHSAFANLKGHAVGATEVASVALPMVFGGLSLACLVALLLLSFEAALISLFAMVAVVTVVTWAKRPPRTVRELAAFTALWTLWLLGRFIGQLKPIDRGVR